MATRTLRRDERTGFLVAFGLHALVVAALLLQPSAREAVPMPERMTVSLTEDVGLENEAPDPVSESRAATAPELAPEPAPPIPDAPAPPLPTRVEPPKPQPGKAARAAAAKPTPAAKAAPAKPAPAKPAPAKRSGGSRLGADFLDGQGESTRTTETRTPASKIGASAKASIAQAVARQIKPHWAPPNGPEVDKIVSFVRFRLNPDGSLSGKPMLARQTGVNDTNRAQASRHGEQAIRAVQLAAPFDLPDEHYEAWKSITANLDWRLAQ